MPTITVVTGRPAAGKSTTARQLGLRMAVPIVSRDAIKTSIVRTERPSAEALRRGGEIAQRSWAAFADVIEAHVEHSISLVIEQSFERGKGEAFFAPYLDRAAIAQVVCTVSWTTSLARFAQRMARDAEARANPTDAEILDQMREGTIDPEAFGPLALDGPVHLLDCEDIGESSWHDRVDALTEHLLTQL